jgi:uncharacterized protein YndB with AHSA1/START domain
VSERSVEHATFVVERSYDQSPERVFAAWSDREAKGRWWGSSVEQHELEFRVGGGELQRGIDEDGNAYTFRARYQDIVPSERIIYSYDMLLGDVRISVSLATVEFHPDGDGTRLVLTEQGAFLDGHDRPAQRRQGMGSLLESLAVELRRDPTNT